LGDLLIIRVLLAALCVLWAPVALVYFSHLRAMRSLAKLDPPSPGHWPRVSVVIAARDEALAIGAALRSWIADDYPDLEVVVVDDRSTDGTGGVVGEAAAGDPRITPLRVEKLPDGWLGKVHALARGVERATGDWLLFSDADVHVRPGVVGRAVALCESEGIDFLAVIPEFTSTSVAVNAAFSVFMRLYLLAFSPRSVRDPQSKVSMGSGGFDLVRKSAFGASPGFEWMRMDTGDDTALGIMMKRSGARCEGMDGRGCASVALYGGLRELFRGLEKNGGTTAGHPWLLTLGVGVLLAVEYAPFAALVAGPAWLRLVGAAALATSAVVGSKWLHTSSGRWVSALCWPAGSALLAAGTLRATWLARFRGGVWWRGSFYPLADIQTGRRFLA